MRPIHALQLAVVLFAAALVAQEAKPAVPAPTVPKRFVSEHKVDIGGAAFEYTVTAGETILRDDDGAEHASIFSFTYSKKGGDATRPITFAYNGGPGSSSVWLHFGLLGPQRVQVPSDGTSAGAPPYALVANPATLLDVSDLVLVDPVGTGFSKPLGKAKGEDFWGCDEDARALADFVRRYLTETRRWTSPKYLLGESYGGIRSGLLLRELQAGLAPVMLNGVVLISPALSLEFVTGGGTDLCHALALPTLAATALYHKALPEAPADAAAFLQQVRNFAGGEYLTALFAGTTLTAAQEQALTQKLHRFTGLSAEYWHRANLRVSAPRFRRELLRDRGLTLGRLDARYSVRETDEVGELPSVDPEAAAVGGAYVATFLDYLTRQLDVHMDAEYQIYSQRAGGEWKPSRETAHAFGGYLDVTPQLVRAQADNPQLRLFVASGLYDTATTFFCAEYQMRQHGFDQRRIVVRQYPSGHMIYLHEPSLQQLATDLRAFVAPTK